MRGRRIAATAVLVGGLAAFAPPGRADHGPLGPVEPGNEEQACIYELNLARFDPPAYGTRHGIDLSTTPAQPPLAVNKNLTGSARFHSVEMLEHAYYGHISAVTGDAANRMAVQNGYDLFGNGLDPTAWAQSVNTIESIAKGIKLIPAFTKALALLIEDEGVAGLGHRVHLLAMNPQFQAHREIGAGRAAAGTTYLYTIHTANRGAGTTFLTGVVYRDLNGNGRYDIGEGLGGATIGNGSVSTTSMAAGGWSLQVGDGTHDLTCTGGPFPGTATARAVVAGQNVEVDFVSGIGVGEVGFNFQATGGPPPGPVVSLTSSLNPGEIATAPLNLTFEAGGTGGSDYAWDFGDGGTGEGIDVFHQFVDPGAYGVVVAGTNSDGTGKASRAVAAGGPAGPGAGTTPPASTSLAIASFKAKANFAATGVDSLALAGTLEMPAGFVAGGQEVQVAIGGWMRTFTLTAKGTATDGAGSTLKLKFKRPKAGAPLGAGVVAKLTIKAKGDLREELESLGLRSSTEAGVEHALTAALTLVEQPYAGAGTILVTGVRGKKASAVRKAP